MNGDRFETAGFTIGNNRISLLWDINGHTDYWCLAKPIKIHSLLTVGRLFVYMSQFVWMKQFHYFNIEENAYEIVIAVVCSVFYFYWAFTDQYCCAPYRIMQCAMKSVLCPLMSGTKSCKIMISSLIVCMNWNSLIFKPAFLTFMVDFMNDMKVAVTVYETQEKLVRMVTKKSRSMIWRFFC